MKVLTEVWCVDPEAAKMNEQLGSKVHDEGDKWLPYAFEILDIRSVKKAGDHEFLNRGEATTVTFHNGESVTIHLAFTHVYELWEKASEDFVKEINK